MKCYCCEKELISENLSIEHIILNSIGGKLKSKDLLCKICNSKFGENFDSEISKQFLFLSTFLNIDRERGDHPILKGAKTESGEEIYLLSGGKPYYSKPTVKAINKDNEIIINVVARNDKELRDIAKGLNKKYPQISIEDIIKGATHHYDYLKEPIKITQTIGGEKALNGIIKTALNYCIHISKNYLPFKNTIEILKNEQSNTLCKHYYPKDLYKKESNEICHIIHIESNKHNKNLIAYVEFFSSYSFVILLSDDYHGKPIKSTYSYDLNNKKELNKSISLKIPSLKFAGLPIISTDHYNLITEKMDRVVKIGLKKQNEKELNNLISRSIDEILKNKYGHEEFITEQMTNELSNHLSEEFVKFIYRE